MTALPVEYVHGDEWRKRQLSTIGGSNAAACVGQCRWKSKAKLWRQLRAVIVDGITPEDVPQNDDMRRGRLYEPIARQLLAEQTGQWVEAHPQTAFLTNPTLPWAHVLPDGFMPDGTPVELKVPRPGTIALCNAKGLIPEWSLQLQHTLAILEKPEIVFGMMDPVFAFLHVMVVQRDDNVIAWLMERERELYDSVLHGQEPDETEVNEAPGEPGRIVLDDPASRASAEAALRLRELIADGEEALAALKDQLVEAMRGNDSAEIPGLIRMYNRASKPRRLFDVESATAEFPELKDDRFWKYSKASVSFRMFDMRERR